MSDRHRTGKPDHSVVWNHDRCWHPHPDDDDVASCDPTGAWTCNAPPEAYCRFGCEECGEEGWADGEDDRHCDNGHELVAHQCWVLDWVQNLDASDTYQGDRQEHSDGPVVVLDWGEEYLTWVYPDEWLAKNPATPGEILAAADV